jgi:hypothetical protein
MPSHSLVVGYHGCERSLAESVAAGEDDLKPSQNAWEWLGHGIYFWEDSCARALRWAEAETQRRGSKIKIPGVLGAVIQLGNCLNLTETESLLLVKDAYQSYVEVCGASGSPVLENRGPQLQVRFLDCAVIETVHQARQQQNKQPFDTVRGFFLEGRELYPAGGFRELDRIQICVRSPRQIIGYFLPRSV